MKGVDRYSWSKRDMTEEEKLFGQHGFGVKKPSAPEPEIKIGYTERIDVSADGLTTYLNPHQAILRFPEKMTERDEELRDLVFERYVHGTVSVNHLIYAAVLAGTVAIVLLG